MKSKAFSLIEIIVSLMILSLIALFVFPSARNNMQISEKIKDKAQVTFALQAGLELGKDIARKNKNVDKLENEVQIGDYKIKISIGPYKNSGLKSDRYIKVKASFGNDSLEVIEVIDEESL
ncbi:type II secretion system protein [Anaerococcus kampingiae]|uniref:Type II secretion system protein n=1 Tax=Anaerococcus kampingae TaxID=3115614 RepID=A0ABW9MDI7_9FIRM